MQVLIFPSIDGFGKVELSRDGLKVERVAEDNREWACCSRGFINANDLIA